MGLTGGDYPEPVVEMVEGVLLVVVILGATLTVEDEVIEELDELGVVDVIAAADAVGD